MSLPHQKDTRTALITGAGGLLGRSLASLLGASGWQIVALARTALDIRREDDVRKAMETHRPDVVFNCAATPDLDRCEREPEEAFEINEQGPRWLARYAGKAGAEMVHVSTDYVFDGMKEGFYTQEDSPNPLSVYARSKLAGEVAVGQEAERFYIIRSSWIFGAGGKNFGSRVIELARSGVRLKGVTDQISIPTYAPDLARRIEEIINIRAHGLYQVTNTGPASWYEFARLALEMAGLGDVEIQPIARAELKQVAPRPHNSAMRCLVSEKLGLAPLRHWRDALPDFIKQV